MLENEVQLIRRSLHQAQKREKFENWDDILDAYFNIVEKLEILEEEEFGRDRKITLREQSDFR